MMNFEKACSASSLHGLKPQPERWVVNRLIPSEAIVLLAGAAGSYKSTLALDAAFSVLAGELFATLRTEQRPVAFIDAENGRNGLALRLERMGLAGRPELREMLFHGLWNRFPLPKPDSPMLLDWAERNKGAIVVFDSLTRFHNCDENSASEMKRVMQGFFPLRDKAGATAVILHHQGKGEGKRYRGSEEIVAGVDIAFNLVRDEANRRYLTLDCFKTRNSEEFKVCFELGEYGRFAWRDK